MAAPGSEISNQFLNELIDIKIYLNTDKPCNGYKKA